MTPPAELIVRILTNTWASLTSTEEHIKIFITCSLVSKHWAAIIKEVNSVHSLIPFSYNGGQLYIIKSLASISNPMLCRTLTFRVNYVIMPQRLVVTGCEPSVAVNRGIESVLRKLICGPNTLRHGTHIYLDYLDDSRVHVPSFWIPPQITRLTIHYYHRSWVVDWLVQQRHYRRCECEKTTVDRQVDRLSILAATPDLTKGLITPLSGWKCLSLLIIDSYVQDIAIPVSSEISVIRRSDQFRYETVEPDLSCRAMFGDHRTQAFWVRTPFAFLDDLDIPMLEQAIPVGSVGYIHPMTRKFIILFNATDPGSSPGLDSIPSLLDSGVTTMVIDPNRSQGIAWERDYDAISLLADWIQGSSLYTVGYDNPELLFLTLGRACSKELIGTHFEAWLLDHKQKILDIFGDEHPYIRKRLELVTTAVDSSQYGWFAHLGFRSLRFARDPRRKLLHTSLEAPGESSKYRNTMTPMI
ncbi:hypothetical protein EV421DRAFT_1900567 [Armillaria borealis]|uniref:Uncharacterized protein n=1 Tax=Armillaria borealis TaxID=47425 RepID=A0AA39MVS0_9AGAR|nr:hypothetical protein EV421DRAFT_1900567 [Armillaria borealis]